MTWSSVRLEERLRARREVASCARMFRERLLPMKMIPPNRDDQTAMDARASAREASQHFWTAVGRLPRSDRRARQLAVRWENAAAMALWHRHSAFSEAEELGAALLAELAVRTISGEQWCEFKDACEHALRRLRHQMVFSDFTALLHAQQRPLRPPTAAAATPASAGSQPEDSTRRRGGLGSARRRRGPFVDQAELRERIAMEATSIRLENTLAGDATSRQAQRRLTPWLEQALRSLDHPMTVPELDSLAAEWRTRREPYMFDDPDWADVLIVEPTASEPNNARRWWIRNGR